MKRVSDQMQSNKNISPVSIYIPAIQDFITVVGACIEHVDGKNLLRLQCETASTGAILLMNPDDLSCYFSRCAGSAVPF